MRIAMVSEHASPLATLGGADAGGQNVHVAGLSLALADLGAEVVVHTRRDDPGMPDRVDLAPGVTVEHVAAGPPRVMPKDELWPHMPEFAANLERSWAAERPDIVHAHFWMSGRAAMGAARPLRLPVVQTFHALGAVKRRHQGAADTSPPERLATEVELVRRADGVVATCSDEVSELSALGADVRRVWVVPCGVDLMRFSPRGPAEARPPGRHRLLVVSRLVERKGIGDVIAALPALPDTELVVAGGPPSARLRTDPEAERLLRLAAELGVGDRVHLRGGLPRAAMPALMRSADITVCVPWYEPFGIVAVEAMATGVPVVASAVGGHLDTVIDGRTGVHVPPRHPGILAAVLRELLADPARRTRLGTAGAHRARASYGWERVARSTLGAYRSARRGGVLAFPVARRHRETVGERAVAE